MNEMTHDELLAMLSEDIEEEQPAFQNVIRGNDAPLSHTQRRLWILDQISPGSAEYILPYCVELIGELNKNVLEYSLNQIIKRHEALRTIFVINNEEPMQIIKDSLKIDLKIHDLSDLETEQKENGKTAILSKLINTPFDLSSLPLLRAELICLEANHHIFVLALHHIISDGWSLNILLRELSVLYNAQVQNQVADIKEVEFQFADYVYNITSSTDSLKFNKDLVDYSKMLVDAPFSLEFPLDFHRPVIRSGKGSILSFKLDSLENLDQIKKKYRVTDFMVFMAVYGIFLNRYCSQNDVLVGVPAACRDIPELENIIGFFVNTIAVRLDMTQNPSFNELLKIVRRSLGKTMQYQNIPFDELVDRLHPKRKTNATPLIQTMFSFQNVMNENLHNFSGLECKPMLPPRKVSIFDLSLDINSTSNGLECILEYDQALFEKATIKNFAETFNQILKHVLENTESKISEIPLNHGIENLEKTISDAFIEPGNKRTFELIADFGIQLPDEKFIFFRNEIYTRKSIIDQVNSITSALVDSGVKPGQRIGLLLTPNPLTISAILAVLSSGGVIVPLDTQSPADRINYILNDSDVKLIITDCQIEFKPEVKTLNITNLAAVSKSKSAFPKIKPDDDAYIIYTSGTTGKPKGVLVTHAALEIHLQSAVKAYGLTNQDTVLQFAPIYFDAGLEQILAGLSIGAKFLIKGSELWSAADFFQKINQYLVTVVDVPPLYIRELQEFAKNHTDLNVPSLRLVISGGEKLPYQIAEDWLNSKFKDIDLINAYGPTEGIATATCCKVDKVTLSKKLSIGSSLSGRFVVLLDEKGNLVPRGVAGQICLGGSCLAKEYINQPDETDRSFVYWKYSAGVGSWVENHSEAICVYKTGDKARYNNQGELEFLGRIDKQLKIRGYRIEPEEIESVINKHSAVYGSCVTDISFPSGESELAAYLVPKKEVSLTELKSTLISQLPKYMIPKHFVIVDRIPLTSSGKTDYAKLPIPNVEIEQIEDHEISSLELQIKQIWQEILNNRTLDIHDNFFESGGNSLLVIRLHTRLISKIKEDVKVVDLFRYPTIASQAEYIEKGHKKISFDEQAKKSHSDIAIIGMAGRFPGAENIDELWKILSNGKETIKHFSKEELLAAGVEENLIDQPGFIAACGYLKDVDKFDAAFFGFTPGEAKILDPQHRIFLEEAWHALEHSGYNSYTYSERIGVFAGVGMNTYLLNNLLNNKDSGGVFDIYRTTMANDKDFVPTRTSYKLNLRGPSLNINTACSSSLSAIHVACKSLLNGECEMALAGGVAIHFPQVTGFVYQQGGIASPDGHCRAFSAKAQGTVGGNGTGIVVLKVLEKAIEDKDNILAVIKGSAINNDGGEKVGFTAPGVQGQRDAISEAYRTAGISPESVSYIEAHGTGTPLGDPIEIEALSEVFGNKNQFCAIGSIKTNIGHLDTAAGVAGVIKTVLSIQNEKIPASLHCEKSNSQIKFEETPFYVNTELSVWSAKKKIAGISSFGMGGSNVHLVIEEPTKRKIVESEQDYWFIPLSAKTENSLKELAFKYAVFLENNFVSPANVTFTTVNGRNHFEKRIVIISKTKEETIALLRKSKIGEVGVIAKEEFPELLHLTQKWVKNEPINFGAFTKKGRKIPLPLYQFEKQKFWVETNNIPKIEKELDLAKKPISDWYSTPSFSEENLEKLDKNENAELIVIHTNTPLELQLIKSLKKTNFVHDLIISQNSNMGEFLNQISLSNSSKIIYLPLIQNTSEMKQNDKLDFAKTYGMLKLIELVRELQKVFRKTDLELFLITSGLKADNIHNLAFEKSIVLGLLRVIPQEYPNLKVKLIDIENQKVIDDFTAIYNEIFAQLNSTFVALNEKRWVEYFEEFKIQEDNSKPVFEEKGVYLITGGTGGMGLTFAEFLAREFKAKIALLTIDKINDRKLQTFKNELEKQGAEILLLQADVSDKAQLGKAINEVSKQFGQIEGVLHTAGVGAGKMISQIDEELVNKVFAPKVSGTLQLIDALQHNPPKFFISCSSLTSILGGMGQSVYCSANSFLNYLSRTQPLKNCKFLSIGWDGWNEVGMAVQAKAKMAENLADFDSVIAEQNLNNYWPYLEHVIDEKPMLPGTGFIDFAYKHLTKEENKTIEIKNLQLQVPLTDKAESSLDLQLKTSSKNPDKFIITSSSIFNETKHAKGSYKYVIDKTENSIDIIAIKKRCSKHVDIPSNSTTIMAGKHWQTLQDVWLGNKEGIAYFTFVDLFKKERKDFPLSPGVLDRAISFLLVEKEDAEQFFPLKYDSIIIHAPLNSDFISYAKVINVDDPAKICKIDVTIADMTGRVLIEIVGYTLVKTSQKSERKKNNPDAKDVGISKLEGIEVLKRVTSTSKNVVMICVNDLQIQIKLSGKALINHLEQKSTGKSRLDISPHDALLDVWRDVLGIDDIKPDDDLLMLGADSLAALQASARLKEKYQMEFVIGDFFESHNIADLAKKIATDDFPEEVEVIESEKLEARKSGLTQAQVRIWFVLQLNPQSHAYNLPTVMEFNGKLNLSALKEALFQIVQRHQTLRTRFFSEDSKVYQIIEPEVDFQFNEIDFSDVEEIIKQNKMKQMVSEELNKLFDLTKAPLIRFALFKLSSTKHIFAATMHHIISDGWSIGVFQAELKEFYDSIIHQVKPGLPNLKSSYTQFVKEQRKLDLLQKDLGFWKKELIGAPVTSTMPTDFVRPAVQSNAGGSKVFFIDEKLTSEIRECAQKLGVTVNNLLLATYYIFLAKYSGQNDLVTSIPLANRKKREYENLIGMFVNLIPIRIKVDYNFGFKEFSGIVSKQIIAALSHSDISFEKLVEELKIDRNLSHSPLYQTSFTYLPPIEPETEFADLKVKILDFEADSSKNDFSIYIEDSEEKLKVFFEYSSAIFSPLSIDRWQNNFVQLLNSICENPDEKCGNLKLISDAEILDIRSLESNHQNFKNKQTILSKFFRAAHKFPNRIAVSDHNKSISYKELNNYSNQLSLLLQEKSAQKRLNIGVYSTRSVDLIVAILAIFKSGNVYVPIDSGFPSERIESICKQANINIILTEAAFAADLKRVDCSGINVIYQDKDRQIIERYSDEDNYINVPNNSPAYIIFTSGSTGEPKGVVSQHAGLLNFTNHILKLWEIDENAIFSFISSISFDASILEIIPVICQGGQLKIVPAEKRFDPPELQQWIIHEKITHSLVTSQVAELLFDLNWHVCKTLRILYTGGQALRNRPNAGIPFKVYNLYGPTEVSVCSSLGEVAPKGFSSFPNIGKPLSNINCYVLDAELKPVPIGSIGELYLGGVGVGLGYLNREEETKKTFFYWSPISYKKGEKEPKSERIYKSGDFVRWNHQGNLEFIARKDKQVKIRGFRIELDEIQKLLASYSEILGAEVVVKGNLIFGFVTSKRRINNTEIKNFLKTKLPAYMIPAQIIQIDAMPVLNSGKIDLKKLTEMAEIQKENKQTKVNKAEQKIIEIWKKILNIDLIHPGDNFFDIGGHSLLLVKVKNEMLKHFGKEINLLDLFKYPTISNLAGFMRGDETNEKETINNGMIKAEHESSDIAVIGMSCRFPGADNPDEFWQNLVNGVDSVTTFTKEDLLLEGFSEDIIDDEEYVPSAGIINDIEKFDADFFGFSPMEANLLDPQQRILLECAFNALEDSGYASSNYKGKIGVFSGVGFSTYLVENLLPNKKLIDSNGIFPIQMGNGNEFCSTRIAYKLNLSGPAISVNTACSTSLTAIHLSVNSLLSGDCDIVLAGGATIRATQKEGYLYEEGTILSKDGKCRAFDKNASGTVGGSGAGIVVLKRLKDAERDNDNIIALIKGSGINNDGKNKIGFTAPGIKGQSKVIIEAQVKANISSDSITFVETHGTGTILGDPIEISALKEAFGNESTKRENCYLGSVKPNIGHLDAASGVAGFIKTVLALKHKIIPKNLNFTSPNPKLEIQNSPFTIVDKMMEWKTSQLPRRAGVSSFGIGGTNVHVVLEEYQSKEKPEQISNFVLIPFSGKNSNAIISQAMQLITFVKDNNNLSLLDLSYSLAIRRDAFPVRKSIVAQTKAEIIQKLELLKNPVMSILPLKIVFMFTGQGSQFVGMAKGLYDNFAYFTELIDSCSTILMDLMGLDIREIMWGRTDEPKMLNSTQYAQPALFTLEYALAKLLMKFGILPSEMIGHSIGELTAAAISEVFSIEDALTLVYWRSKLMAAQPEGSMLAISLPELATEDLIGNELSIAVINGSKQTVVSGNTKRIEMLHKNLSAKKIRSRILPTSHAFHSKMMNAVLKPFYDVIKNLDYQNPEIPFISNVTGKFITNEQAKSPQYWADQIRSTVRFQAGISELLSIDNSCFIEIGPASVLCNLTKQNEAKNVSHQIFALQQRNNDAKIQYQNFLSNLGKIWESGIDVQWNEFFAGSSPKLISLPTYPFQRKKYWIDKIRNKRDSLEDNFEIEQHEEIVEVSTEILTPSEEIIKSSFMEILGIKEFHKEDDFFSLGGDSLMAASLISLLKRKHKIKLKINDLMQNPSVSSLAALISEPDRIRRFPDCLIKLSKGDKKYPPIFMIHAIGGGALIYNDLLKNLNLRNPVFGIKAVGLWDKKEPLKTVQAQAKHYLKSINEVAGNKRIHLVGCSYGGLIAFEISKMMEKGKALSTIMFDSPGPGHMPRQLNGDAELFAYMLDSNNDIRKFADYLAKLSKVPESEMMNFTFEIIRNWPGYEKMKQADFADQVKVLKTNMLAMNQYKTEPFVGKIHFFKAMESDELNAATPELAWLNLAKEGIEIIPCSGNHISMLSEPNVKDLAIRFAKIIEGK